MMMVMMMMMVVVVMVIIIIVITVTFHLIIDLLFPLILKQFSSNLSFLSYFLFFSNFYLSIYHSLSA